MGRTLSTVRKGFLPHGTTQEMSKNTSCFTNHAWLAVLRHIPHIPLILSDENVGVHWTVEHHRGKGWMRFQRRHGNGVSPLPVACCTVDVTVANWTTPTWWCFCLPARSERSHIQLSGPTTARSCPCHFCSPYLHSGGKNLLTTVTQRALRCCSVKRWVNVNDSQVTRAKSIWPFFLCLHRGWKGRGWARVEMSCYWWYYQCWWLFQMSWELWAQTEPFVPKTVIGHFAMSL